MPTTHLALDYLSAGSATPEVVINGALDDIDAHVSRYVPDTTLGFRHVDDFLGGLLANGGPFVLNSSGTGSGYSGLLANEAGHPGIAEVSTGTTTTGYAAAGNKSAASVFFGGDAWKLRAVFRLPVLSDGTNTYTAQIGFGDTPSSNVQTDGAMFRYTHSVNSGKLECVTIANGVETVTDTGVTVAANTWYRAEIDVTAAGVVTYSLKVATGALTLEATHSGAAVPTGSSRATSVLVGIGKLAGTTARILEIDLLDVSCIFGTSR